MQVSFAYNLKSQSFAANFISCTCNKKVQDPKWALERGTPQFKEPGTERFLSRVTIRFRFIQVRLKRSNSFWYISAFSKEFHDQGCQRLSEDQKVSCLLIFLLQILSIFDFFFFFVNIFVQLFLNIVYFLSLNLPLNCISLFLEFF